MSRRQVVLDTETTGLSPRDGHRIIEIGCVEILARRISERTLHYRLNPEREIDAAASAVHGMTLEDLLNERKFAQVADELLEFVRDAEVIIHNAAFDVEFLDSELARLGRPAFATVCEVTDTLKMAREMHPGKRNTLDALCERYGVANRHRTLHGALLDAGLLAEVYLAMTCGQDSLAMDLEGAVNPGDEAPIDASALVMVKASAAEIQAHEALLDRIARQAKRCIWRESFDSPAG